MTKNIDYSEKSIRVLEGLEAVRMRPGMYIGSTGRKGLNHLIYEIVDNSVDEHLAGCCDKIIVVLEPDGSCTVSDNGRGIPVGLHEKGMPAERLVFTTLHAGGKFDNNVYKTSGGLHGVGSSVVNALSTYMDVRISRDGYIHHDRFERGIPVIELENGRLPVLGKTKETGTTINFLPDSEIFETTRFSSSDLKSRLHETAYLNPNLTIQFCDRRDGRDETAVFHELTVDLHEHNVAFLCVALGNHGILRKYYLAARISCKALTKSPVQGQSFKEKSSAVDKQHLFIASVVPVTGNIVYPVLDTALFYFHFTSYSF